MKRSEFKKLKKTISGMTRKQALDHMWTYYKGSIIMALVVVVLLAIIIF